MNGSRAENRGFSEIRLVYVYPDGWALPEAAIDRPAGNQHLSARFTRTLQELRGLGLHTVVLRWPGRGLCGSRPEAGSLALPSQLLGEHIELCSQAALQSSLAWQLTHGYADIPWDSLAKHSWSVEVSVLMDSTATATGDVPAVPPWFPGETVAALAVTPADLGRFVRRAHELLHSFRKVKLRYLWADRDGLRGYPSFAAGLKELHARFPGRIMALVPWVLLDPYSLSVGRRVCDFRGAIGLRGDGRLTLCGRPDVVLDETGERPVREILRDSPLLHELAALGPSAMDEPCSRCLFATLCGNQCPVEVYTVSGSFAAAWPDCRALWEEGLFPEVYVCR